MSRSLYSSLVGLKPLAFLCFELPAGTFDVNVTPDKRSVFIQRETAIMTALGQASVIRSMGHIPSAMTPSVLC